MKIGRFLLAVLIFFGSICPAKADTGQSKDMTLMVYLCGSNLESNGGAATKDISEMLHSGFDADRMNIVLMAGGSEYWFCGFPTTSSNIYLLKKGRPQSVWRGPLQSMGQADTLSFFLNYARENYPAKRYGLILWDHGGGPQGGVCTDTQFNGDSLTLTELQSALEETAFSQERLSFIGFDACLMASLEVALGVAPYADFMVASQETEPGDGWNYSFLKGIEKAWGKEIGRRIVDSYFSSAGSSQRTLTLSCIDLSKVGRVEEAASRLFGTLAGQITEDSFPAFAQARKNARSFGSDVKASRDYDLVDILSLAKQHTGGSSAAYTRLKWALNSAVTYSKSSETDCCGLSLYHPYYNSGLFERNLSEFVGSPWVPAGYKLYINRFYARQSGSSGAEEWDILSTASLSRPRVGYQRFMTRLSRQQQEIFASAQFLVLGRFPSAVGSENWAVVYSSPELQPVENGYLSWRYYGEGIYAVDDETGEKLAGPILNLRLDSGNTFYTILRPETVSDSPASIVGDVLCRCLWDEETGWFQLKEALIYDEVLETYTPRQSFCLEDYPSVQFPNSTFLPAYREDGTLLPPETWEPVQNASLAVEVENGSWHLEYCPGSFEDAELFGCFLITDVLNQTTITELSPVTITDNAVRRFLLD